MKTQVCIIGGGPAGMLLSRFLYLAGISSIVLEKQSRDYVLSRVRAGMLESGTVDFLRQLGLSERLDKTAFRQKTVHYGFYGKDTLELDLMRYTGKYLTGYGQTYISEDVYNAADDAGLEVIHNVESVALHQLQTQPYVTYVIKEKAFTINCDLIVGCDGFHGISRKAIPEQNRRQWTRSYPLGWLGILSEVPPMPELFYAFGSDGFVLASKRTLTLSRYYVQCPIADKIADWPDDRFWDTVFRRIPSNYHTNITTGPSIEKSIAPLRSFVCTPMQYGKLFLAGDSAHIVPPTGAKGLNLAVSDVYYLGKAIDLHCNHGKSEALTEYSKVALKRVWAGINLSWQLTKLLHRFEDEDPFDYKIRQSQFDLLLNHEPIRAAMAYEKVGLPL